MRSKKSLHVVGVADLHVGSRVGLADPKTTPTSDAGAPIRSALFDIWGTATTGKWKSPDVLIVNGDAIEGPNRKGKGLGTWSTEGREQIDEAVHLLRMWKARHIYVIRGSNYHVDRDGDAAEEILAQKLKAEVYPNQEDVDRDRRVRSGWHWYLHLAGVTFHVAHHIAVSKVFHYQSTPTARQMLQAKLNDQLRHTIEKYRTDIVLRAHAHYYNTVGFSGSQGYVMPCWKGLDEFMQTKGALDISPDIGFLAWEICDGEARFHKELWGLQDVQPAPLSCLG